MKTLSMFVTAGVVALFSACDDAPPQQTPPPNSDAAAVSTFVDTPEVEVRVNRRFDEGGNLIAYDSIYSSFYSTRKGDKRLMDSLFSEFRPDFEERFPFLRDDGFDKLFFSDSLLYPDFFHEDFFRKRMELNEAYMQRMMQHMDSVKNEFFRSKSPSNKRP